MLKKFFNFSNKNVVYVDKLYLIMYVITKYNTFFNNLKEV